MSKTIKLTIQEMVLDFEQIIRTEEHINTLQDIDRLDNEDSKEFKDDMEVMVKKYIPNYKRHVPVHFFQKETSDLMKAEILSSMLRENFREMFYQLV